MSLAIHLLGAPRVERDGTVQPAPRGHKAWGLLAYLVCQNRPASRTHLAQLLFEEAADPLAALRWSLSQLRRALGDAALCGDARELSLAPDLCVDIRIIVRGPSAEALRMPGLGHELLEGMSFATSPSFAVWLATERRRLQAGVEAVLREAALARLSSGDAADAAELASRLVRLNPLDENYQALLVRSLAAAGDGVGAARQAAACRELFQRELGVQPGETLAAALRTHTATPTARAATGHAGAAAQLEAGEAAIGAGALEPGLQCLRRAIVEADTIGDALLGTRARLALGGALVHAARGRDEEGATALHEALAIGRRTEAPLAAAACRELAYVEFLRGRCEHALRWLRQATSLAGDDPAEQARIATLRGCVLSDTAHYTVALDVLGEAEALALGAGDAKQAAYAQSMQGRALMLCGDLEAACEPLDRSLAMAKQGWTAFVPWPLSLRAELDLLRGQVDAASDRFEHAFALGCQFGDPCWEGIAGRGLGLVAMARGQADRAVELLVDAINRCVRLPDAYLWGKGYALDPLCRLAVAQGLPQARSWIDEMHDLAARGGMRELTVRSHLHRAGLGDNASRGAARWLAGEIDNPALTVLIDGHDA